MLIVTMLIVPTFSHTLFNIGRVGGGGGGRLPFGFG